MQSPVGELPVGEKFCTTLTAKCGFVVEHVSPDEVLVELGGVRKTIHSGVVVEATGECVAPEEPNEVDAVEVVMGGEA